MREAFLAAVLLGGCAHARFAASIPPECAESLAGTWRHEANASYLYDATDDGVHATLTPRRVNADGTPMADEGDVKDMRVELERSQAGFEGNFRMVQTFSEGHTCPLLFAARVTACSKDRLTLEVEQSYAVNEACERTSFQSSDVATHVLVRVK